MGRKVHPIGFRLGIVRDWQSKWHTDRHYVEYLQEDMLLRKAISARYGDAGVSLIEIERPANKIIVTVHTARPGIVIGRGGQRVDETRRHLEELIGKKLQLNVQEVRQPEMDAYLVARSLAEQIERRVAYRRAMKQALFRSMQAGAQGIKINCAGRLGGVEIARSQVMHQGRVPLHTLRADVDYGFTEAHTIMGRIGIKVWLYRGDVLPEQEEEIGTMEAPAPAPAEIEPPASEAEKTTPEATPKPAELVVPAAEPAAEGEVKKEETEVKAARKTTAKKTKESGEASAPTEETEQKTTRKKAKGEAEKPVEQAGQAETLKEDKPAKKTTARRTAAGKAKTATKESPKTKTSTKKAESGKAEAKAKPAAKKSKASKVKEKDDAATEES
jgi:small subunit ribosomal protein S3